MTNPFLTKSLGNEDTQSRSKADSAARRASEQIAGPNAGSGWPRNARGTPLIEAEMSCAELIPTGNYANVSIGPARIRFLIDPERDVDDNGSYFPPEQWANIARALNEAADIVGSDVIAVQRNLVLESMQEQIGQRS